MKMKRLILYLLTFLSLTGLALASYKTNIGAFQRDTAGDYYTNIGADQTDESAAPVEEATTGAQVIVIIQM